ncbi:unnamed protein product [Paramecium octaurelia]|uniref:Uncharacterized protein n=1 Tax=Paramecium octaurelia TaxID=43137 RepID=A0A8S1U466_PAROT|nr:unnamed protein product [Paramecium octaurelia]
MNQNEDDLFLIFVQRVYELLQSKQVIQALVDNGFDQWEQTKELTIDILSQLGVPKDKAAYIIQIINEIDKQPLSAKSNSKPLTLELMAKGLNKKKDYSKRPPLKKQDQLSDCCVLSLNGLGLTSLNDCISMAKGLQVLHIYDNNLQQLVLQDLQFLRILNAQNNQLKSVEFEQLPSLEKAYLDKNCLTTVPILPGRLNTLSLSNQNTKEFQFPDESFELAAFSLINLTCENSNVEFILTLGSLQNLEYLNLKNNKIKEFDDIEDSISNLQNIKEIDLRGNPITQVYKYRDRIVLLCKTIQTIDSKTVLANERQYLINLGKQKILRRNQSLEGKKQTIQKPSISGVKQKILSNEEQRSHQQQGISKTINSANYFNDNTPIMLTKHK